MAELKLEIEERAGGIGIIHVVGAVDFIRFSELQEAVRAREEAGDKGLVVDLTEMEYISSSGVSVLIKASAHCDELSRKFCLVRPKDNAQREFFRIAGLDKHFTWAETTDEAVVKVTPAAK